MYETIYEDRWLHKVIMCVSKCMYETIDTDGWLHRGDNVCEIMYV